MTTIGASFCSLLEHCCRPRLSLYDQCTHLLMVHYPDEQPAPIHCEMFSICVLEGLRSIQVSYLLMPTKKERVWWDLMSQSKQSFFFNDCSGTQYNGCRRQFSRRQVQFKSQGNDIHGNLYKTEYNEED